MFKTTVLLINLFLPQQAGLIEANGELKVFIDQNLSPGKGEGHSTIAKTCFLKNSWVYSCKWFVV